MIAAQDKKNEFLTSDKIVTCNGGDFGHPAVRLEVATKGKVKCPYCGRVYIYNKNRGDGS